VIVAENGRVCVWSIIGPPKQTCDCGPAAVPQGCHEAAALGGTARDGGGDGIQVEDLGVRVRSRLAKSCRTSAERLSIPPPPLILFNNIDCCARPCSAPASELSGLSGEAVAAAPALGPRVVHGL